MKKDELEEFVHRHNIDIIALNETHLNANLNFKLPNFTTYRSDRITPSGGSAILVKTGIKHYSEGPITGLDHIEANSIVLLDSNHRKIRLTSVYGSPRKFLTTQTLNSLFKIDLPIVAMGDFNAEHASWNSRTENKRGTKLLKYAINNNIHVESSTSPTYYSRIRPNDPPDWLDVAATRGVNLKIIDSICDLTSDHVPVLAELQLDKNLPIRTIKKTDWDEFTLNLHNNISISRIKNTADLDAATETFTTKIQDAMNTATTFITLSNSNRLGLPPWLQEQIKERNKARKTYQLTKDPTDKRIYYDKMYA